MLSPLKSTFQDPNTSHKDRYWQLIKGIEGTPEGKEKAQSILYLLSQMRTDRISMMDIPYSITQLAIINTIQLPNLCRDPNSRMYFYPDENGNLNSGSIFSDSLIAWSSLIQKHGHNITSEKTPHSLYRQLQPS